MRGELLLLRRESQTPLGGQRLRNWAVWRGRTWESGQPEDRARAVQREALAERRGIKAEPIPADDRGAWR